MKVRETKICPTCLRPFQNRKRWSSRGIWNEVVHCSDRCRKATVKVAPTQPTYPSW